MKAGIRSDKKAMKIFFVLMISIFMVSGCDFVDAFKKEARTEKKILGYVEGYNPRVKEIEKTLKEAGFNPGPIDGTIDKQTRGAIKDFQRANRLAESGFIDEKTWARLSNLSIEMSTKKQQLQTKVKSQVKPPVRPKKVR